MKKSFTPGQISAVNLELLIMLEKELVIMKKTNKISDSTAKIMRTIFTEKEISQLKFEDLKEYIKLAVKNLREEIAAFSN